MEWAGVDTVGNESIEIARFTLIAPTGLSKFVTDFNFGKSNFLGKERANVKKRGLR